MIGLRYWLGYGPFDFKFLWCVPADSHPDLLRFLLRLCHQRCPPWHWTACYEPPTYRDPCRIKGMSYSILQYTHFDMFKWWWACEPVYVLSNLALKLSIGVMLIRIAVVKKHKIIIWIVVVVFEVYGTFYFFLFVLQCRPSAYFWTQYTGGKGTCINPTITVDATYAYSAISCWTDWTLAIIPMFIVWNLQMNIRTKIGLSLILAMAAL